MELFLIKKVAYNLKYCAYVSNATEKYSSKLKKKIYTIK